MRIGSRPIQPARIGVIEPLKQAIRRRWPRLRLRTILLLTFVFVAALPGVGALFLRVYENTLVRQTEAELIAQGAALAAIASADWPGAPPPAMPTRYAPEPPTIDLRLTAVLPERPPARAMPGDAASGTLVWRRRLAPILAQTSRTTLAGIALLDRDGRILVGADAGRGLGDLPEVCAALAGRPMTTLRRNDAYSPRYAFEWLSRASNLRIHHARPIMVGDRVVGVLLLSRSPRSLFVGIYEDRGKIVLGIVLIFVSLVGLSGLLSRGIVRPIEALGAATRAVAEGRGTVPDPPSTAAIEIQALYRDFAVMAADIDHRSRYLRDFAYAVSHEFKTPLTAIGGAIELLQDHPDMAPADHDNFLDNISKDAHRLSQLVARLLDLARADMTEPVDGVASDLVAVLRQLADAYSSSSFAIHLDLSGAPLPPVAAPAAMLSTAIASLIENSIQAGATSITLSLVRDEAMVILTLHDDGLGIPARDRHRIFEPFFTSRRDAGGTGLGLAITRSLLAAHGGSVDHIAAGTGTAFVVSLQSVRTA